MPVILLSQSKYYIFPIKKFPISYVYIHYTMFFSCREDSIPCRIKNRTPSCPITIRYYAFHIPPAWHRSTGKPVLLRYVLCLIKSNKFWTDQYLRQWLTAAHPATAFCETADSYAPHSLLFQLLCQCFSIHADPHTAYFQYGIQHRIIQKDITV